MPGGTPIGRALLVGLSLLAYLGFVGWFLAGVLVSRVGPWVFLLGPLALVPPLAFYWVAARRRRRRQGEVDANVSALISAGLINEAIAYLRSLGLGKVDSIVALSRVGMDHGAAKLAVHESLVWGDRFASDSVFHESLGRALAELEREGHISRK